LIDYYWIQALTVLMHLGLEPEHAEQCNWESFRNIRNADVSKVFTGVCIIQTVMCICYKPWLTWCSEWYHWQQLCL